MLCPRSIWTHAASKYSSAMFLKLPRINCEPKSSATEIKEENFILTFQRNEVHVQNLLH